MNGHNKRGFFHRMIYSRVDKLIVMSPKPQTPNPKPQTPNPKPQTPLGLRKDLKKVNFL